MNTKLMTAGAVATMGLCAFCAELALSDVKAKQRSLDNGLVDISFDVTSDSNTVSVIFFAMNTATSQMVPMKSVFDGDGNFVGNPAKIAPGAGKKLVWNSAIDLGKGFYSDAMVITARATEKQLPPSMLEKLELAETAYEQAKTDFVAVQKEVCDFNAGSSFYFQVPMHRSQSWSSATVAGRVFQVPLDSGWTYAMAAANVPYETELMQDAMDNKVWNDTLAKLTTDARFAGVTSGIVMAFRDALLNRRNLEDDLKNAQFAYGIKTAIAYDYANGAFAIPGVTGITVANGTKASVDMASDALLAIYNTDPNAKLSAGMAAPVVDNLKVAKDVLDDCITCSLPAFLAVEARKLINDYEVGMATVATNKDAWEDAINARSAIMAGMTDTEIRAKADEINRKRAEANELVNIRMAALAAAKAACGR